MALTVSKWRQWSFFRCSRSDSDVAYDVERDNMVAAMIVAADMTSVQTLAERLEAAPVSGAALWSPATEHLHCERLCQYIENNILIYMVYNVIRVLWYIVLYHQQSCNAIINSVPRVVGATFHSGWRSFHIE